MVLHKAVTNITAQHNAAIIHIVTTPETQSPTGEGLNPTRT